MVLKLLSTPSDMFPSRSIGGAIGSIGSTIFTTLAVILWTNHALLIFYAAGSAHLLTLMAFNAGLLFRFAGSHARDNLKLTRQTTEKQSGAVDIF